MIRFLEFKDVGLVLESCSEVEDRHCVHSWFASISWAEGPVAILNDY